MRLSAIFMIALTFAAAGVVSLVAASFSVQLIEDTSEIGVRDALDDQGMTWAEVQADGCLLYTSPSPRDRQKSRMPSSA